MSTLLAQRGRAGQRTRVALLIFHLQSIKETLDKNADKSTYEGDFVELEHVCCCDSKINCRRQCVAAPPYCSEINSCFLLQVTDATKKVLENLVKEMPSFIHPNPGSTLHNPLALLSHDQLPAPSCRCLASSSSRPVRVPAMHWPADHAAAESKYPHASAELAAVMTKGGEEVGDTPLGQALKEAGDSFSKICEANYSFVCRHRRDEVTDTAQDDSVNQEFVEPLKQFLDTEVKEVMVGPRVRCGVMLTDGSATARSWRAAASTSTTSAARSRAVRE